MTVHDLTSSAALGSLIWGMAYRAPSTSEQVTPSRELSVLCNLMARLLRLSSRDVFSSWYSLKDGSPSCVHVEKNHARRLNLTCCTVH